MCPQPLSRVNPNCNYAFGSHALAVRPEEAALVAVIISGWSTTEAHLGHVFAALIGARTSAAMNMYSDMRSFDVQERLLRATVRSVLPIKYYDLFEMILAHLRPDVR